MQKNPGDPPGSRADVPYYKDPRFAAAAWIAIVEGILVITGALSHLAIYILAPSAVLLWVIVGREQRPSTFRLIAWVFAVSQVLTLLVPIAVAKLAQAGVLAILAVLSLTILILERQ